MEVKFVIPLHRVAQDWTAQEGEQGGLAKAATGV